MKRKLFAVLASGLFLLGMVGSAHAVNIYFSDFENGIGPEWSPSNLRNAGNSIFTSFLGRMGNQSATLNLSGLGNGLHEVTLEFDFYAILRSCTLIFDKLAV